MLLDQLLASRHLHRYRRDAAPAYRSLSTRRGTYFVNWSPEDVKALVEQEALAPADLACADRAELHSLTRDLFLLGLQDELATQGESSITGFARQLMRQAR